MLHTQIHLELWQLLVLVGGSAIPLTFVAYWMIGSLMRVPSTWHEFWGKFKQRPAIN